MGQTEERRILKRLVLSLYRGVGQLITENLVRRRSI